MGKACERLQMISSMDVTSTVVLKRKTLMLNYLVDTVTVVSNYFQCKYHVMSVKLGFI